MTTSGLAGKLCLLTGGAMLALCCACSGSRTKEIEKAESDGVVVSVKTAKAEKTTISAQVSAVGTIVPKQQATISAKISATIQRMAILKNRNVRTGEVIAVLETRDLEALRREALASLQEARLTFQGLTKGAIPQATAQAEKDVRDGKANLENARLTLERRRVLFGQNGISKRDLEASELAYTTAENQLRLAESSLSLRWATLNLNDRAIAENRVKAAEDRIATLDTQIGYATVRAPYAGVVTEQFQFQGEFAAGGAKLVTVADTSEVIVKAPFPDTVAAQIRMGETAVVKPAETADMQLSGRVTMISPASDPLNRSVEVWVRLANPGRRLRPGGAAEVVFPTRTVSDAIVVPMSSVTLDATNAEKGVIMVVDGKMIAHEARVTVGIRTGDRVQITSGLKGDETVVTEGGYALPDGTHVQLSSEKGEGAKEEQGGPGESKQGEGDRK